MLKKKINWKALLENVHLMQNTVVEKEWVGEQGPRAAPQMGSGEGHTSQQGQGRPVGPEAPALCPGEALWPPWN